MKRFAAILILAWCLAWSGLAVYATGVASNPQNPTAGQTQGPDTTGNVGWPFAVVNATGTTLDVNNSGSGGSVTQGTSPWIVGNQWWDGAAWQNWPVSASPGLFTRAQYPGVGLVGYDPNTNTMQTCYTATTDSMDCNQLLGAGSTVYNSSLNKYDRMRSANSATGTTGLGLLGAGAMYWDGANWQKWGRSVTQGTSPWVVGFGGVGQPVSIASGQDVTEGATTDAIVISGNNGTVISQLKGINQSVGSPGDGAALFGNNGSIPALLKAITSTQTTSLADGTTPNGFPLCVFSYPRAWNGSNWDRPRTPSNFKTVATAAAGNTAIWTPTGGKKFRLMRWRYTATENCTFAVGANLTISLFDGAAGATGQVDDITVPAVALATSGQLASSPWIDLGNGYQSVAANNVLNVNLSAALVTGTIRVQVAGTEE